VGKAILELVHGTCVLVCRGETLLSGGVYTDGKGVAELRLEIKRVREANSEK